MIIFSYIIRGHVTKNGHSKRPKGWQDIDSRYVTLDKEKRPLWGNLDRVRSLMEQSSSLLQLHITQFKMDKNNLELWVQAWLSVGEILFDF